MRGDVLNDHFLAVADILVLVERHVEAVGDALHEPALGVVPHQLREVEHRTLRQGKRKENSEQQILWTENSVSRVCECTEGILIK